MNYLNMIKISRIQKIVDNVENPLAESRDKILTEMIPYVELFNEEDNEFKPIVNRLQKIHNLTTKAYEEALELKKFFNERTKECDACDGSGEELISCCGDDMSGIINETDLCPTCHEHTGNEMSDCSECQGTGIKVTPPTSIKKEDLKNGFYMFGNKGAVWSNKIHIAQTGFSSGSGTLCKTPMLSRNWADLMYEKEIGCSECIEEYNKMNGL